MEHNEYTLSHIIAGLEWYARVASRVGHCVIPDNEINAYLKAVKELTEEKERLIPDTITTIQTLFAIHLGTYTDKDTVRVADVFKLMAKIKEDMIGEETK